MSVGPLIAVRAAQTRAVSDFEVRSAVTASWLLGRRRRLRRTLETSWRHVPTSGVFSSPSLDAGLRLLLEVGLAVEEGEWISPHAVLCELQGEPELAAVLLSSSGEPIIDMLRDNLPLRDDAEFVGGSRLDVDRAHAIGLAGEIEVIRQCRLILCDAGHSDLAEAVVHVAKISDSLGYDVWSPTMDGGPARLEVKTTTIDGAVATIHLSRGEHRASVSRQGWRLVVCRVDRADRASVIGWLDPGRVQERVPVDQDERGQWETTRIDIGFDELVPGLPL